MNNLKNKIDVLLVNAPGKEKVYQSLASDLAAYEPPIWAGFIAEYVRTNGHSVQILDAEALRLSYKQTVEEIRGCRPLLTVFVVYGQQPSASTQCMAAAGDVARMLKQESPDLLVMFMGTHSAALPERTLREEATNFVCNSEGPLTVLGVLETIKAGLGEFHKVPGLWYVDGVDIVHTDAAPVIQDLDNTIPGIAWDLLPMNHYRAHNWHCWDNINEREPYASIYTSLGCPYKCSFCCINAPFGSNSIRYFSSEWVIRQIDILVREYGVKNIKFADEMFVLNSKHVLEICDHIIERGYDLNIWAYARVDTVKKRYLDKMKKAGFNWLAIGIESGSKLVRNGVEKGRFGKLNIKGVVEEIQNAGIYIGANYIFGLPDDTLESMRETLELAIDINSEWANFYSAMAYPGSPLYAQAIQDGVKLPDSVGGPGWIGYSQHAKECLPLPANSVGAGKVLFFRDQAFDIYFKGGRYQNMMRDKFGSDVVNHINGMTKHKLDRDFSEQFDTGLQIV
jgi:radical SAM superfamily enzyme YgiQ (UPF0313 family)